jgi:transposase
MGIIHTCKLADVNPFDYITALQKHSSEVFKNPQDWMPWNYKSKVPPVTE